MSKAEKKTAMQDLVGDLVVNASVKSSDLDDAWHRDLDGTATVNDFELINRVFRGEDYQRERSRRLRVREVQRDAGSWETVKKLENDATQIESETKAEIARLQSELDEHTRRITAEKNALTEKARVARAAAERMRQANLELRTRVPPYVQQFSQTIHRRVAEKYGNQINDLKNQIGPREAILNCSIGPEVVAMIKPHSVPPELTNLRRMMKEVGKWYGDRWDELVRSLPSIQGQFEAELPEMKLQLEQLEKERDAGFAQAESALDCYLPA